MTTPDPALSTSADVEAALRNARVRAWSCLIPEHGDRRVEGRIVVTVDWRDGVAHCMAPGCELTSEHTQRFADALKEHLAAALSTPPTERTTEVVAAVRAIVYSHEAERFRDGACRGLVENPYANNRYVRLLDDVRRAVGTEVTP